MRKKVFKDKYRSGFEKTLCDDLKAKKYKFDYEKHTFIWVDPTEHKYTPDIVFEKPDGSLLILEAKGYFDPAARKKMKWVKKCNPDLDIRFVFMNPKTKISRTSKTTYGDWATKNGFPFCGPEIEKKWLDKLKKVK